ncbi:unnamed protein product, partial [Urochloa humidicola]
KKGGSSSSRKKGASSPRDAAAGTQPPHPSALPPPWTSQDAAPSTQRPLQRVNASFWPEFGGGIHGGQSTSSANQWVLEKDDDIRDRSVHRQLKKDLVEHIWNKHGQHQNLSTD